MKLILFDIDGTILRVDRSITRGLTGYLIKNVLGSCVELEGFDLHGKTDRQIMRELSSIAGLAEGHTDEQQAAMEQAIVEHWRTHLRPGTVTVLPGVRNLIERLYVRSDVALGLLTGNLEAGARLKLGVVGLNEYFPFGAFGSDAELRSELAELALKRACEHYGRPFDRSSTLVIGDSHRDIECARSASMRVLAVATGNLDAEQLAAFSPDGICENLLDDSFLVQFLDH